MHRSSSERIRVADVLARRLARETSWAFGVPGGEVLTVIDALEAAGVRFVVTRHETSAGFMAEGVQRLRGGVGLLVATVGPGVANTINAVAHSEQARRALIVLTGCVSNEDATTYTHQVFDHQQVLRPLCKASFRVAAETAADTIERAVTLATEGVPGPVHVDVPVDVADAMVDAAERPARLVARPGARPSDDVLQAARAALAAAKRPLVLAGLELLTGGGDAPLRRAVERAGIPVMTTYEAKGVVDEHAPTCLGGVGLSPKADAIVLPLAREADVVLLAGYDPVEMRHAWRHPFHPRATIIEVTRRLGLHGMHQATHSLVGEPALGLQALLDGLELGPGWSQGEPAQAKMALEDAFRATDEWGPSAIFEAMQATLDDESVIAVDTGAHRILFCQQWRFRRPGLLMQSNGTSTMACAIPFAIGAKASEPSRPVVAVLGDGGLEMALGELGTMRDLELAIPIIVLDDRSLALIEKKQRSRGLKNVGVDFGPDESFEGTDYAAIARAFGGHGARVSSTTDLRRELAAARGRSTFTLIHCPIERRAYDGRI